MRTIKTIVYTIDEHPNKENIYNWIRNNWYDINDYSLQEVINSIKALTNIIGGTNDYSISTVSDRGEYITFNDYDNELLNSLNTDDCPLTGVCWDIDIIEGLKEGNSNKVLNSLHTDTEYKYSDEGLYELCQANQYEFTIDGEIY